MKTISKIKFNDFQEPELAAFVDKNGVIVKGDVPSNASEAENLLSMALFEKIDFLRGVISDLESIMDLISFGEIPHEELKRLKAVPRIDFKRELTLMDDFTRMVVKDEKYNQTLLDEAAKNQVVIQGLKRLLAR